MTPGNIFQAIPGNLSTESFEDLLSSPGVRIERIVSKGHVSPKVGWYDQDEHEWVIVMDGMAIIEFEGGDSVRLEQGDYVNIPAHCRHRVSWTDPQRITVWLAVFYG